MAGRRHRRLLVQLPEILVHLHLLPTLRTLRRRNPRLLKTLRRRPLHLRRLLTRRPRRLHPQL